MRIDQAVRNGEWLELGGALLAESLELEAGSHPHLVRKRLLALSLFPEKWINRLFSVGGIRWRGETLQLLTFSAVNPQQDNLYRQAMLMKGDDALPAVLYEDDYCLVMNKPAGMPVHAAYPGQPGTLDLAAARHVLLQNDPLPVRHIHRLDDYTSGPVLYSKNDLAQLRLDEAMRDKLVDRRYIAVVHGAVKKRSATIDRPIGKDRHHAGRRRVVKDGDSAVTRYELVQADAHASIVRIKLETGRTHQIRVHMSSIGHPLLGDALYGGDTRHLTHQALHGERLQFPHPLTNRLIEAAAPWPQWLTQLYEQIQSRAN